jgi:hypothetical protein
MRKEIERVIGDKVAASDTAIMAQVSNTRTKRDVVF